MFFKKPKIVAYDSSLKTPVLRCSICTGETVAGFRNKESGKFTEDMLITSDSDLELFRKKYSITGEIKKIY